MRVSPHSVLLASCAEFDLTDKTKPSRSRQLAHKRRWQGSERGDSLAQIHPPTYIHTRRTARPHMAQCYLFFPFLVDILLITEQQKNYKTFPSSQNKTMVWEQHPWKVQPDKIRSLGILKDIMKGIPPICHTQTSCFNRDDIPMSIEAFPLRRSLRHSLLSVRQQ